MNTTDKTMLKQLLLQETSRSQINYIRGLVFQQARLMESLFQLIETERGRLSMLAAWVILACHEQQAAFVRPHLKRLAHILPTTNHNGVRRCFLKIIAENAILEEDQAFLLDYCFSRLLDPKEAIAVKVHAMQILYNLSRLFPEITRELADVIEMEMPHGSAGFRSRGKKILNLLHKNL